MVLKIIAVQNKPFNGQDGQPVNYYWTKAEKADGVLIQFGGMNDYTEKINTTLDIAIEKQEFSNGKIGYKETKV